METDREVTWVGEEKRQGGKENGGRTSEHEKESVNGLFMRRVAGIQQQLRKHALAFQGILFYLRGMSCQPSRI